MNYSVYDKGQYRTTHLTEDTMWGAFSMALSGRSRHVASYKFGFLKSILDNLYEVDENLTLSFDQLFGKFALDYTREQVKLPCPDFKKGDPIRYSGFKNGKTYKEANKLAKTYNWHGTAPDYDWRRYWHPEWGHKWK